MSNHSAVHSAPQNAVITKRVDMLYDKACRQFPTYETMVYEHFCSEMIETFGDDEMSPEAADAFSYARSDYDYRSPAEIRAAREVNRSHGICSHGLTKDTCPCGCFEFTGLEVYEDFGPEECDLMDDPDLVMSDEEWTRIQEQWRQKEIAGASGKKMVWVSTHTKPTLVRGFFNYLWNVALRFSASRRR
ncbi:regulator [Pseudomonas amygdali]|uniref:regulator n=1 Tax=Pseudomonas amygdali TaxID=47877 RepID=UPI000E3BB1A3|nr:regulator [Pseudomonas amygdali]